jgi:hypothetical protein
MNRIKSTLTTIVPDGQPLTVDELAPLDQFHIRGMLATAELASAAGRSGYHRRPVGKRRAELQGRRRLTRQRTALSNQVPALPHGLSVQLLQCVFVGPNKCAAC